MRLAVVTLALLVASWWLARPAAAEEVWEASASLACPIENDTFSASGQPVPVTYATASHYICITGAGNGEGWVIEFLMELRRLPSHVFPWSSSSLETIIAANENGDWIRCAGEGEDMSIEADEALFNGQYNAWAKSYFKNKQGAEQDTATDSHAYTVQGGE